MTEEEIKENKDPFADVRKILYGQSPETREAEMRAQKNRAKATAFLQAFGTIADAFTLSKGGDVPKRDLNPYIMNNMQRADAMGEQDRADKKAWENSLLNLENNVAQYNARRIETARQREWEEAKIKQAQAFQRETEDRAQERWKEQESIQNTRKTDFFNLQTAAKMRELGVRTAVDLEKAQLREDGRIIAAGIRARNNGSDSGSDSKKVYLRIPDPENPAAMISLDESETLLLFRIAFADRENDDDILELIQPKESAYTRDEMKGYVELIAKQYPDKIMEYFGELYPAIRERQGATPQVQSVTPQVQSVTGTPANTQAIDESFVGPALPPPDTKPQPKSTVKPLDEL